MGSSPQGTGVKAASDKRREARREAEKRAIATTEHLLKEKAPNLVSRQKGAGLSRENCEKLVNRIQEEIETAHLVAARKHLRNLLKELRDATGGDVSLPAPATYIKRDKSPFSGNSIALVGKLECLLESFMMDIRQNLNEATPAPVIGESGEKPVSEKQKAAQERKWRLRTLGRIIFSAVVNGGLLNQDLYRRLPAALCDDLHAFGEFAWVTFPLDEIEPEEDDELTPGYIDWDAAVRRWFLDPVTLGLVARWRCRTNLEEYGSDFARTSARVALVHYLKYLQTFPDSSGNFNDLSPQRINDFFQAARARLSLYLPPVLIRFLSSTSSGQSMSERTWWRYQYGLVVDQVGEAEASPDMTADLVDTDLQEAKYQGDPAEFFKLQKEFMEVLQDCLGEPGSHKKSATNEVAVRRIEKTLQKRKAEMAPLVHAYYRWIAWKLTRPSRKQGRIRCSSARRYTSRLGKQLVAIGAEVSMEKMSDSDWEEFYADVIECIKSAFDRSKAVGNLRDFHRFLMIAYKAAPATIEGQADPSARSRSTLITEDDYLTLMKVLSCEGKESHQARVLRIIAMLMFRAGLRPNELIGLEYGHIQGASVKRLRERSAWPVLYLRATSREVLKTPSGVRQIPLPWFLTDGELEEFQGFLHSRLSVFRESNRQNAIVLTSSLGTNTQISEKEYFGRLTELLREITGDSTVVAYTLRHGCLSNMFHDLFTPQNIDGHAFLRNGLLPREAIYALSTMGGHLDPDISMQSYIHTQDIVCHLHIRNQFEDVPIAIWAALEGRKEATLHQRRTRRGRGERDGGEQPQWLDTARRLVRQLGLDRPKARSSRMIELPDLELKEASLLDLDIETIHALLISKRRKHSREGRAQLFGLPVWQIEGFSKTCKRLAGYQTESTSGKRNLRHLKPHKKRKRLPELYRRAQPDPMGPAPPHHSRQEMSEANRIYRLLAARAVELKLDRDAVRKTIVEPIRDLLLAYSGSEAVVRTVDAGQFASAIESIRSLNIPPARIEVEIEALPKASEFSADEWSRQLRRLARSRKIRISERCQTVTRRSQAHPDFGITKIRVLALGGPEVGELRRKARARVKNRAGAGWRVGCFYAFAAITALLWAKKAK